MDIWDLYFASIAAMSLHPGYNRENVRPLTLNECADITDEMVRIREERIGCLSQPQE